MIYMQINAWMRRFPERADKRRMTVDKKREQRARAETGTATNPFPLPSPPFTMSLELKSEE
jgi:hypothetical protein